MKGFSAEKKLEETVRPVTSQTNLTTSQPRHLAISVREPQPLKALNPCGGRLPFTALTQRRNQQPIPTAWQQT